MPLDVEKITQDTNDRDARVAISSSIKQLMSEGKSQKEAAGQAYSMAEERLGRQLPQSK